ncbi:MAG: hypothetical protein JWS10_1236 [Cypionkella sp.]|uniref:hypothetical protein n=1 Tax=Cypionkella sp. TaxID=2811411 RepID=UPI002631FA73|nr:hypothetical protein [Cypionkella sp.]MDB5658621.1 hypothetical protein [Cypionkella sp.]
MSDNSFRTVQAVSDLVHHVKPLLAQHLAAVAEASGLTLRETGEAFAQLRDDGFRFQREETLALLDGLETIAITQAEGFELAVVVLLADVLQRRQVSGLLVEAWEHACKFLRDWPTTLRAAVANGLRRTAELATLTLQTPPTDADCQTRKPAEIAAPLLRIARSMRRDELYAVAQADRGDAVEQHFAALMDVIGKRDGIFPEGEVKYPSEVVELRAGMDSAPGFEGCTAILLLNVLKRGDKAGLFTQIWPLYGAAYCALRPSTHDPILAGVRHIYETDTNFLCNETINIAGRLTEGATIPVLGDPL